MLEQTPVRSAAQEVLTHGHEGSKVGDGIRIEVVELRPKEIQETTEENTWRQREPTVDVGSQKNTLTLFRLWLPLVPREPRCSVGDQTIVGHISEILLGDGRPDPIPLDPALRQAGPGRGSSPTSRSPFHLPRRRCLLRALQSRRLLLHHCCRRGARGVVGQRREQAMRAEVERAEGGIGEVLFKNPRRTHFIEPLPSG